jgi:Holliday junction DNA helicase RuvA
MIGFLEGTIELRDDPHIYINVNGVGYKVFASHSVLVNLSQEKIKVYTYTHVREDLLELYGFVSASDLKLFEKLVSVSGIGPKTAIGIFSLGSSDKIIQAITTADLAFFTAVPRLGKKNAQKLIIELKGKLGGIGEIDLSDTDGQNHSDVIAALKSFGFSTKEASEAIKNVPSEISSTEEKVRVALKFLGK